MSDRPYRIAKNKFRVRNAVFEYLTQGTANNLNVPANAMSEFIAAHFVYDFAVSIDERCTLHIGACRHDGIVNPHSP